MSFASHHTRMTGTVVARPTPQRAVVELGDKRIVLDVAPENEERIRSGLLVTVTLAADGTFVAWQPTLARRRGRPAS